MPHIPSSLALQLVSARATASGLFASLPVNIPRRRMSAQTSALRWYIPHAAAQCAFASAAGTVPGRLASATYASARYS